MDERQTRPLQFTNKIQARQTFCQSESYFHCRDGHMRVDVFAACHRLPGRCLRFCRLLFYQLSFRRRSVFQYSLFVFEQLISVYVRCLHVENLLNISRILQCKFCSCIYTAEINAFMYEVHACNVFAIFIQLYNGTA